MRATFTGTGNDPLAKRGEPCSYSSRCCTMRWLKSSGAALIMIETWIEAQQHNEEAQVREYLWTRVWRPATCSAPMATGCKSSSACLRMQWCARQHAGLGTPAPPPASGWRPLVTRDTVSVGPPASPGSPGRRPGRCRPSHAGLTA